MSRTLPDNHVICPGCNHDFRAISQADQWELASLKNSLEIAYRQVDNMAGILRQLIEAHENVDSGADIPVHIYKQAKAVIVPMGARAPETEE